MFGIRHGIRNHRPLKIAGELILEGGHVRGHNTDHADIAGGELRTSRIAIHALIAGEHGAIINERADMLQEAGERSEVIAAGRMIEVLITDACAVSKRNVEVMVGAVAHRQRIAVLAAAAVLGNDARRFFHLCPRLREFQIVLLENLIVAGNAIRRHANRHRIRLTEEFAVAGRIVGREALHQRGKRGNLLPGQNVAGFCVVANLVALKDVGAFLRGHGNIQRAVIVAAINRVLHGNPVFLANRGIERFNLFLDDRLIVLVVRPHADDLYIIGGGDAEHRQHHDERKEKRRQFLHGKTSLSISGRFAWKRCRNSGLPNEFIVDKMPLQRNMKNNQHFSAHPNKK